MTTSACSGSRRTSAELTRPGWSYGDQAVAKQFGETWQESKRTLLLIVPSFVARIENNFLLNPEHRDSSRITHSLHQPVWWDDRLY